MNKRPDNADEFLSPEEQQMIEAAVAAAEKNTSAEIKVIILRHCWRSIKRKAVSLFRKYNLDKTKERNCVLILLVTSNREFLIYGDKGIYRKTTQEFWDSERDLMARYFSENKFGEGLAAAVKAVGDKLAEFFSYKEDDENEIDNKICFEK